MDCVERWAKQVEQQLQKLSTPSDGWRQADAALNLLCIGAAIGGRLKAQPTAAELIEAVFSNWPDEPAAAGQLRTLYAKLLRHRDELIEIARSNASSLKGGRTGAMLDPRRVLAPIRQLRRAKWRLSLKPPEDDTGMLAKLYREVVETLPGATVAERLHRIEWLQEMQIAFGNDATRASIVSALTSARQAVLEAGTGAQNSSRPLQDALDAFQTVHFDATVGAARTLLETEDAVAVLPEYGRGRANAVSAGTALRMAAERFLDSVELDLQSFSGDQDARAGEAARDIAILDEALGNIVSDLAAMEAGHVA